MQTSCKNRHVLPLCEFSIAYWTLLKLDVHCKLQSVLQSG